MVQHVYTYVSVYVTKHGRWVYLLHKSIDFHDIQIECQIIPIHFLLIISHKMPVMSLSPITPWSLPNFSPIAHDPPPQDNTMSSSAVWMYIWMGFALYFRMARPRTPKRSGTYSTASTKSSTPTTPPTTPARILTVSRISVRENHHGPPTKRCSVGLWTPCASSLP